MIWKINCRAEYVEPELFGMLRDAGLYLVYMGLESGTEGGLEVLHKQITVEQNRGRDRDPEGARRPLRVRLHALRPLAAASTRSARTPRFLHSIVADGSAAATFCRMLPYGGTPIRDQLREEGRLRGDVTRPDYDFLDPRLNEYHRLLDRAAAGWIHGTRAPRTSSTGPGTRSRYWPAWPGRSSGLDEYRDELAALTRHSNAELFGFVEESSLAFEAGDTSLLSPSRAEPICSAIVEDLLEIRNRFVTGNEGTVLAAIERSRISGPIVSPQIF